MPWASQGSLTHSHAVLIALDDIKGVSKVPFCDVEDDVGLVGGVQRCDSPQKDDLLRTGELSKGGQRDDGVGDGMYRVPHAGLIVGTARLDAADGVCFLLAEGVCGAAIVLGAFKGQTAEAALDVEASLIDGTVMDAGHTLINVLAVAAIGS